MSVKEKLRDWPRAGGSGMLYRSDSSNMLRDCTTVTAVWGEIDTDREKDKIGKTDEIRIRTPFLESILLTN